MLLLCAGLAWAAAPSPPQAAAAPVRSAAGVTSISFAGYPWTVKTSAGTVGPGPNQFSDSPQNVWVDAAGQLHLRITHRDGRWQCAEVTLGRSLGYGTYAFTIASAIGNLDPNVVLGLFTWDDAPADNHREIDIEFARWGNAASATNAQYAIQPVGIGQLNRFAQPQVAPSRHSFAWSPKQIAFLRTPGATPAGSGWLYKGRGVPRAGAERAHINLWLDRGRAPTDGAEIEVVLSGFSFVR
jgi:hypothetical protein